MGLTIKYIWLEGRTLNFVFVSFLTKMSVLLAMGSTCFLFTPWPHTKKYNINCIGSDARLKRFLLFLFSWNGVLLAN